MDIFNLQGLGSFAVTIIPVSGHEKPLTELLASSAMARPVTQNLLETVVPGIITMDALTFMLDMTITWG